MKTAIYKLIDPFTKQVRYIGKSVNPNYRYSRHLWEAKKCAKKKYLYCWIKQLLNHNSKPIMEIIEYCDNWQEREKYWISFYKDTLTNISEGGEGSFGYKHTKDWKNKASERMLNNTIMNGRKLDIKTKEKMSKNNFAKKNAYCIYQYDRNLNFLKKWNSVFDAANYYKIQTSCIYNNIVGLSKTTKYGIWKKELITN